MHYLRTLCAGLLLLVSLTGSLAQTCTCSDQLTFLVNTIETNYIGFSQKVTNREAYTVFVDSLQRGASSRKMADCLPLLQSYTGFFADQHLDVFYASDPQNPAGLREAFAATEKIVFPLAKLQRYLNKPGRDPLEGIYTFEDNNYRIAIVKSPTATREYAGIILQADSVFWMPYQVKMEITRAASGWQTTYYTLDHAPVALTLAQTPAGFSLSHGMGDWTKVYPSRASSPAAPTPAVAESPAGSGFTLEQLNEESLLLTLPHFMMAGKPIIDSLMEANRDRILSTKNLIIDLRDNPGGGTPTYERILPFLYTNPIASIATSVLATEANIAAYKRYQSLPHVVEDPDLSEAFAAIVTRLEAGKGTVVDLPADTTRLDTVYPYPANVAFLVNEQSASAAELFLLQAQQSRKVTIFGQPTSGAVDYLDGNYVRLPDGNTELLYPLSRNDTFLKRYPSGASIPPHVVIPEDTSDWVAFVLSHLKTRQ